MMTRRNQPRAGYAWLELLLTLAVVALVLQLFPSLAQRLWQGLDVRTWSLAAWVIAQAIVLALLVYLRFGPQLTDSLTATRSRKTDSAAREQQLRQIQERRKILQGIKEGRRRRIM